LIQFQALIVQVEIEVHIQTTRVFNLVNLSFITQKNSTTLKATNQSISHILVKNQIAFHIAVNNNQKTFIIVWKTAVNFSTFSLFSNHNVIEVATFSIIG